MSLKKIISNNYHYSLHLRVASSRLFKMILNTNWASYRLHTVQLFPSTLKTKRLTQFIGVGALVAPLSATYFAQSTYWSRHFLISLSLAILNIVLLAGVFRFQSQDGTSSLNLIPITKVPPKKNVVTDKLD